MSEAFVLSDDVRPGREASVLFSALADTIVARETAEVFRAPEALSAAREDGFFAAGYFAHELYYALEPRLAPHAVSGLKSRQDGWRFAPAYR